MKHKVHIVVNYFSSYIVSSGTSPAAILSYMTAVIPNCRQQCFEVLLQIMYTLADAAVDAVPHYATSTCKDSVVACSIASAIALASGSTNPKASGRHM